MRYVIFGFIIGSVFSSVYHEFSGSECINKYAEHDRNIFFVNGSIYELNKLSDTAAGSE